MKKNRTNRIERDNYIYYNNEKLELIVFAFALDSFFLAIYFFLVFYIDFNF